MKIKDIIISSTVRKITYILIGLVLGFITTYAKADYPADPIFFYAQDFARSNAPTAALSCGRIEVYEASDNNLTNTSATLFSNDTLCNIMGTRPDTSLFDTVTPITSEYICDGIQQQSPTCIGDPPDTCESGETSIQGEAFSYGGAVSGSICVGGCSFPLSNNVCVTPSGGTQQCQGTVGLGLGASCTPDSVEQPVPEHDCISQGLTSVTINGVVSCVSPGTGGSDEYTTINNTDNSVTNNTTNNTTTSSSTTTTTATGDGNVTTETTTTTNDGQGGTTSTTETTDQDQPSFCEENPTSQICSDDERESTGGSTCDSPPTCTGDAIDCVIQKQVYEHRCHSELLAENYAALPEAATYSGTDFSNLPTDQEATDALNSNGDFDIDLGQALADEISQDHVDQPVGICPPPISFTVLGSNHTIPLDLFCDIAPIFKIFVMFFALITAVRIYSRVLGS